MKPKMRWSSIGIVSAAAIAIPVAVAECGLRSLAPIHLVGIQDAYQYDDELGYRLAAGVHRYRLTDHLEEIRTNALGTVNFQESFERYPRLVFAVGDSFTQGTGVAADASYPFQLDLLLNRGPDGRYVENFGVVNLGLAAFGGEQSILSLRRYEAVLGRPAFVLYLGSDNDWEDDALFEAGHRHRHVVPGSPRWGSWVRPMLWLGNLELVKRAKLAYGHARLRRLVAKADGDASAGASISVAEREWPVIQRVDALAREWGASLVVSWATQYGSSYDWLRDRAAEADVAFADWRPQVESVLARMPDLSVKNPHSGGHWRTWVNQEIARSYAREMGFAPAPPAPSSR
jgi:hypothetical protein